MNHLKELLEKQQFNIDLTARDEFRQLDILRQEDAHTLAIAILSTWYDTTVENYAKDFLQDLDPDYDKSAAYQLLREIVEDATRYEHHCQQIILSSKNAEDYFNAIGPVFIDWNTIAFYALKADILILLDRLYKFNWITGEHETLEEKVNAKLRATSEALQDIADGTLKGQEHDHKT